MEGSTNITGSRDYSFDYFLKFTLWMFSLVYIKFEERIHPVYETFKEKCLWRTREIFQILTLTTSAFGVFLLIVNSVVTADDFFVSSKCIVDAVVCFQVTFKAFSTIRSKKDILEIFHDLKELSVRRSGSDLKYQVKSYFDEYQRFVRIYASSFLMVCLLAIGMLLNFWIFGVMNLSSSFWFPFDPLTTSMFPVAALWGAYMAINFSLYLLAVDSLIFGLITLISMEFDILKLDISEVDFTSDDDHAKTFETFVERHNKLYEITDRLQKIYGSSFFLSFAISSVMICLIAFQISQTDQDVKGFSNAVSYFVAALGQMFLLCFYGQKLIDSSAAVAEGIFNSNWIEIKENSSKRQLVLMIQRSQNENKLTAMNFVDVSLRTFATVFSSAYSYYTFVRNVYGGN